MALAHSRPGARNPVGLGDSPRHPLAQTAHGNAPDALEQDVEEWIGKPAESGQLEARLVAGARRTAPGVSRFASATPGSHSAVLLKSAR
jgi:hypothetical protein